MKNPFQKYITKFSENSLWRLVKNKAKSFGEKAVYSILLLFYAYKRKETPHWARNIIIGTLGYVIAPIDAIPDLTPVLGYTDDIGVLGFGLVTVACYINDEVRKNARGKLKKWFGSYDEELLEAVDEQL